MSSTRWISRDYNSIAPEFLADTPNIGDLLEAGGFELQEDRRLFVIEMQGDDLLDFPSPEGPVGS